MATSLGVQLIKNAGLQLGCVLALGYYLGVPVIFSPQLLKKSTDFPFLFFSIGVRDNGSEVNALRLVAQLAVRAAGGCNSHGAKMKRNRDNKA